MITRQMSIVAAILGMTSAEATTLERLSMEDMIRQSTEIIRGKIVSSYVTPRGSVFYTHYKIQVLERWKGTASASVQVSVPGGRSGNIHQTVSGAPTLATGSEYLLFLWTGRNGVTQVIGLSQGVFDLTVDAKGQLAVNRAAAREKMLDSAGRSVADAPVNMSLADLDHMIRTTLAREMK